MKRTIHGFAAAFLLIAEAHICIAADEKAAVSLISVSTNAPVTTKDVAKPEAPQVTAIKTITNKDIPEPVIKTAVTITEVPSPQKPAK